MQIGSREFWSTMSFSAYLPDIKTASLFIRIQGNGSTMNDGTTSVRWKKWVNKQKAKHQTGVESVNQVVLKESERNAPSGLSRPDCTAEWWCLQREIVWVVEYLDTSYNSFWEGFGEKRPWWPLKIIDNAFILLMIICRCKRLFCIFIGALMWEFAPFG